MTAYTASRPPARSCGFPTAHSRSDAPAECSRHQSHHRGSKSRYESAQPPHPAVSHWVRDSPKPQPPAAAKQDEAVSLRPRADSSKSRTPARSPPHSARQSPAPPARDRREPARKFPSRSGRRSSSSNFTLCASPDSAPQDGKNAENSQQ